MKKYKKRIKNSITNNIKTYKKTKNQAIAKESSQGSPSPPRVGKLAAEYGLQANMALFI